MNKEFFYDFFLQMLHNSIFFKNLAYFVFHFHYGVSVWYVTY